MTDPIADPTSNHAHVLRAMLGEQSVGPDVFRRASELGIFPTVRAHLAARDESVAASDPGWKRHLIGHTVRAHALVAAVRVLEAEAIEFVVLKGIPLGRELYGDARKRSSSDIDLLVHEASRARAERALETLGYVPQSRFDPDANRERELVHEDTGLLIDLHWRIAFPWVPAPPAGDLLARKASVWIDGETFPVLSRGDRLLHLFLHFHDHVGFAKGLLDLAAFFDVHGADVLVEVAPMLEDFGLEGVASWPLDVLRRLGGNGPEPPRQSMAIDLWAEWTSRGLRGALQQAEAIRARHPASFKIGEITPGEQVALKAATMALLDRRRDRLRAMTQPIVSSPGALARKRGAPTPSARDLAAWASRPAQLVVRQIREMTRVQTSHSEDRDRG